MFEEVEKVRPVALDENIIRNAHDDYFNKDISWRKLEAKYGIGQASIRNAFIRLNLPLRTIKKDFGIKS